MEKSKDQELLELQLLERKNARLEKELELKDMKAEFFDMMIDIAEKEYNIDIRKNSFPEQSKYQRNLPTARDKQAEILPSAMEHNPRPAKGH